MSELVSVIPDTPAPPSPLAETSRTNLAPVDEYGMPYAIAPTEPPVGNPSLKSTEHHAFYRRRAPQLLSGLGLALRVSRVHDIPDWIHEGYHKQFKKGLATFPESRSDTFGLLILSCAGYLSRDGWHRRPGGTLELARMSNSDYEFVRSRHRLHVQTELNSRIPISGPNRRRTQDRAISVIGLEIAKYTREQNLEHIRDKDFVDEFLTTKDPIRKYELGRVILREAANVAVDPVRPMYSEALAEGLMRTGKTDPLEVVMRIPLAGDWEDHEQALTLQLAA